MEVIAFLDDRERHLAFGPRTFNLQFQKGEQALRANCQVLNAKC